MPSTWTHVTTYQAIMVNKKPIYLRDTAERQGSSFFLFPLACSSSKFAELSIFASSSARMRFCSLSRASNSSPRCTFSVAPLSSKTMHWCSNLWMKNNHEAENISEPEANWENHTLNRKHHNHADKSACRSRQENEMFWLATFQQNCTWLAKVVYSSPVSSRSQGHMAGPVLS